MDSCLKSISLMAMKQLLYLSILLLIYSCKGETESLKSSDNLIESNVRKYFFMGDSVKVDCAVTDTIYSKELDEIFETIEENIRLVQMDIDTLGARIDSMSYAHLEEESYNHAEVLDQKMASKQLEVSKMKLMHANLRAQRTEFQNSSRLYMHLKRSQFNNIAGYGVEVRYELADEKAELRVLMDADFKVVD